MGISIDLCISIQSELLGLYKNMISKGPTCDIMNAVYAFLQNPSNNLSGSYFWEIFDRIFDERGVEVLCVFVNAVRKENNYEKQTLYQALLHLLQFRIYKGQTEDKMSVVLLGSLQKLSDDFCDYGFLAAHSSYLQNSDLNNLSYVHKLIDTFKSVSSTQSVEFDFFLIYILQTLFCLRSYEVLWGFVKDNFKIFQSMIDAVKKKKRSDGKKQTLYEVLLHLLQYVISTVETEDKMSVVLLGSLQKLSDDFCDEVFWEAFKSYLERMPPHMLSFVCNLIDTLKSFSSTQSVEFEFYLIYILKKMFCNKGAKITGVGRVLFCLRSFEMFCGFVKDNSKKFKSMMDVVKMKIQSDEKQPLYEVLLHLLDYMNSDDKMSVVLLGSLQKLSDDFCDEDFWEAFKSYLQDWELPQNYLQKLALTKNYLQRPDFTWFLYVCKLIDNIKSTSSTATEAFDFHSISIIKIILNETNVEIPSRMNIVNRGKESYEKQILYKIRLHLLQLMLSTEQTDGSMTVILGSLQNLSDDFCDEDFWEVYRRYLLGFDLNKVSFLSRLTYTIKEAYPKKTKDFDLYLFYILERLFYETNKPGAFVNNNLEMFITMVDKAKTKKKSYKTVCPVLLNLLQSWISTEQFKDKMIAVSYFSKDFLAAVQSDPLKHYKKKMSPLMRLIYTFQQKANERRPQIGEMGKRNRLCLLLMLVISLIISSMGHKSAQLKKYLALKYEYDKAILYLLWCSGDVEINPGPPTKKDPLIHDSEKERKWIQDMSSTLLKLYREDTFISKVRNLWKEKPEHWPSSKPFYDTKNKSKDKNGDVITDKDLLTCLIECCKKKNVPIPVPCQYEINAWKEKKAWLLFKLHTYRIETEKMKSAIENLMSININSIVQILKDNNVSLHVESGIILIKNQADRRTKCQAEMVADITRGIATIVCKIIKGKDPEKKCDGIWKKPPDEWPQDIPYFNPYNRGKYRQTCPDKELTETFLQHPKAIIPSKYKDLVATYQIMVKSTKPEKRRARESLCKIHETQINIAKLDYALQYLHKEGLFKQEVHDIIQQWWTTQQVDQSKIEKMSQSLKCTHEKPEVLIKITHNSIKLSAKSCDQTCQTKTTIDYTIPVARNPTAQVNNQPCASTSCHRSHDNQQNQLQTESTGNQQGSPSQTDVNCSIDNQPDVSSNHFSQKNSSNDQSDTKDDGELPYSTEGTSNTQTVFINKSNNLQSTAKPKIDNRCKGSPTKPDKYKSKKILSTTKQCLVKNASLMTLNNQLCSAENCDTLQSSKQLSRTDDEDCGLVPNSTTTNDVGHGPVPTSHTTDDIDHGPVTTSHTTNDVDIGPVTNSLTTDDVDIEPVTNSLTTDDVDIGQVTNSLTTDDVDIGPVTNSLTTDDVDIGPVTNSPTTDDVDTGPVTNSLTPHDVDIGPVTNSLTTDDVDIGLVTNSLTTDDSQLISKTEKRKHVTDEIIPCNSKRSCLETDKKKRKPAIDESLPTDNMDDDTCNADETLPSLTDLDFLSDDLHARVDSCMADYDLSKNSSEINDKRSQLVIEEIETFLTDMINYESDKISDIEKELSLDMKKCT